MSQNYEKTNYRWNNTTKNPDYQKGLRILLPNDPNPIMVVPDLDSRTLRSCLINDNAEKFQRQNPARQGGVLIKTEPKWITHLNYYEVDKETGEIMRNGAKYQTNELKSCNARKIALMTKFSNAYQAEYQKKNVSLLMHTFTRANYSDLTFRRMMDNVKYAYKSINRTLKGYVWVSEVAIKDENDPKAYDDDGNYLPIHWHYHLATCIDRLEVHRMPNELKFEMGWGQRTGVEFVRKNVRHYMAKYFAKHSAKVIDIRAMGKSRHFN